MQVAEVLLDLVGQIFRVVKDQAAAITAPTHQRPLGNPFQGFFPGVNTDACAVERDIFRVALLHQRDGFLLGLQALADDIPETQVSSQHRSAAGDDRRRDNIATVAVKMFAKGHDARTGHDHQRKQHAHPDSAGLSQ